MRAFGPSFSAHFTEGCRFILHPSPYPTHHPTPKNLQYRLAFSLYGVGCVGEKSKKIYRGEVNKTHTRYFRIRNLRCWSKNIPMFVPQYSDVCDAFDHKFSRIIQIRPRRHSFFENFLPDTCKKNTASATFYSQVTEAVLHIARRATGMMSAVGPAVFLADYNFLHARPLAA